MINIAVCDDDLKYLGTDLRKNIGSAIKISNLDAKVEFFTDGNKLLKSFEKNKFFDIVILDIDMPAINGKELAQKLRVIDSGFYLIFVTSYSKEITNVIQYEINAFIDKSGNAEKSVSEFTRVFNKYKERRIKYVTEEVIYTIDNKETVSLIKIPIENIYYFHMENKKIYLYTGIESFELKETVLERIAEKYSDFGFYQNFRNYLVNICKVKNVEESSIVLDNDVHLVISRRNRKPILKAIAMLMSFEGK